jgi:hypothetical protein
MRTTLSWLWVAAIGALGLLISCGDDEAELEPDAGDNETDTDSDTDSDGDPSGEGIAVAVLDDGTVASVGTFLDTVVFGQGEPQETTLVAPFGAPAMSDTDSDVDTDTEPPPNLGAFIVEHAADGTLDWGRVIDSDQVYGEFYGAEAIAADASGSLAIAGGFFGELHLGHGEPDAIVVDGHGGFIAGFAADGTPDWATHVPGSEYNDARGVSVTDDGALRVGGNHEGTAIFAPGEPEEATFEVEEGGSFLARYELDGSFTWARISTGTYTRAMATASDGASYLAGSSSSAATFNYGETDSLPLDGSGYHNFAAGYDSVGGISWASAMGSDDGPEVRGIGALDDGGSVVTGWYAFDPIVFNPGTSLEFELDMGNCAENNYFLVRFDAEGTALWAKSGVCFDPEGLSTVNNRDVTTLADGSSLVLGWAAAMTMLGAGEENETSFDSPTDFLARYGPDGQLVWARSVAGENNGLGVSEAAGVIAVAGSFEGSTTFGLGDPNETDLDGGAGTICIATYDLTGQLQWVARAGGLE